MIDRYERHNILPSFGKESQLKLSDSSVLVIGAGGLGSPVLMYLAASGIGRIGIVDDDVVSLTNLQRQVLYSEDDIDNFKVSVARETLLKMNSDICVDVFDSRVTSGNISEIIDGYDVVVDAVDSFVSKFLINDYCVKKSIPLVHGGVLAWRGNVMTIVPESACYRCVFNREPEHDDLIDPVKQGVFSPLVGMVGVVQASEVIKFLTGVGSIYKNKLYSIDMMSGKSRVINISKNKSCSACS